jgi:hypothetical protein
MLTTEEISLVGYIFITKAFHCKRLTVQMLLLSSQPKSGTLNHDMFICVCIYNQNMSLGFTTNSVQNSQLCIRQLLIPLLMKILCIP